MRSEELHSSTMRREYPRLNAARLSFMVFDSTASTLAAMHMQVSGPVRRSS